MKKRFIPIRGQVIGCCMILIGMCVVFLLGIFGLGYEQDRCKSQIIENQNDFTNFYSTLKSLDGSMNQYFSSSETARPQIYGQCGAELEELETLIQRLRTDFTHSAVTDFCYMADTYRVQAENTLQEYSDGENEEILKKYEQTQRTKELLENSYRYVWKVINEETQEKLEDLKLRYSRIWSAAAVTGILFLMGYFGFVIWFSRRLLEPVMRLTGMATAISKGEKEPERMDLERMTKNELQILADAFYHLLDTTNRQFQMLAEKADLEQRLKDEQLCRVTMESQLHRARLQMFQSLVNPHFLFNTLSVGADLADEEEAPRTQEFIEHLSVFLRYSLTYLNKTVTISQEAQNLRLYFYMQQLRFKERFRFLVEIDPDCERIALPAMILQPLAENALQHGVGSYSSGGVVACRVSRLENRICLCMEDNGIGMTQERTEQIKHHIQEGMGSDFSEGIGLLLVYQRLQDFFDHRAELEIESSPGIRTVFRIMIPEMEETGDRSDTGR